MADRRNRCVNPGAGVDVSGWSGGIAPTRATGLVGMGRTTGAQYAGAGSYFQTPSGAVAPGDVVTLSCDVLTQTFDDPTIDLYVFATRSAGGDVQVGAIDHPTLVHGAVSRFAITRTMPALATGCYILCDGINFNISTTWVTAVLIEVAPSAGSYFDGTVPGPPTSTWDGTAELSASTLHDSPPITGDLAGSIPMQTAALTGEAIAEAMLAGSIPMQQASLVGGAVFAVPPSDWLIEQAGPYWRISQD